MKFYRPKSELDGKRLYAQTLASFMASQRINDPMRLSASVDMPVRLVDFLLRETAVKYWRKHYWLRPDPFNEHYRLTPDGAEKIVERLTEAAGAQSVSTEEVLAEFQIVVGQVKAEPLAEFEYSNGAFAAQAWQLAMLELAPSSATPSVPSTATPTSASSPNLLYPDELPSEAQFSEGMATTVLVNRYERSPEAREACIRHYSCSCQVCGINFQERYGPVGIDFIHVHHVVPIAQVGHNYVVNPIKDLVPVCPNCHAMLHRREPPLTVEALRALLNDG